MENEHKVVIEELNKLLIGGGAHITLQDALSDLKPSLRGVKLENMPYSIWQLVEHIRIAQWDMLNFCTDADHKSPKWPEEYWPNERAPKDDSAWESSIAQIDNELDEFISLLEHSDIYQKIPHGDGQTILREALQIADHNAYHIAEIVTLRRLMGDWKIS